MSKVIVTGFVGVMEDETIESVMKNHYLDTEMAGTLDECVEAMKEFKAGVNADPEDKVLELEGIYKVTVTVEKVG